MYPKFQSFFFQGEYVSYIEEPDKDGKLKAVNVRSEKKPDINDDKSKTNGNVKHNLDNYEVHKNNGSSTNGNVKYSYDNILQKSGGYKNF